MVEDPIVALGYRDDTVSITGMDLGVDARIPRIGRDQAADNIR